MIKFGGIEITADGISALIAALALWATARQIRIARIQARQTATFEHVRSLLARVPAIRDLHPAECQAEILRGLAQPCPFSEPASKYFDVIDELELLGLAYQEKLVDRRMIRVFVGPGFLKEEILPRVFLKDYREAAGDATLYEHLERMIADVNNPGYYGKFRQWLRRRRIGRRSDKPGPQSGASGDRDPSGERPRLSPRTGDSADHGRANRRTDRAAKRGARSGRKRR